jgi:hypothetical protein
MGSLPNFRDFELTYTATLQKPASGLYFRWGDLYASLLDHFAHVKMKPSDIRIDNPGSGAPSDYVLLCYLLDFSVIARFRIGSVEIWTRNRSIIGSPDTTSGLMEPAIKSVCAVEPTATVGQHFLMAMGHFEVEGDPISARLAHHVNQPPEGAPPMAPLGVSFVSDLPGDAKGFFRLEQSLKYVDRSCGFVRVECEFPGATNPAEACKGADAYFRAAFERLDLTVEPAS